MIYPKWHQLEVPWLTPHPEGQWTQSVTHECGRQPDPHGFCTARQLHVTPNSFSLLILYVCCLLGHCSCLSKQWACWVLLFSLVYEWKGWIGPDSSRSLTPVFRLFINLDGKKREMWIKHTQTKPKTHGNGNGAHGSRLQIFRLASWPLLQHQVLYRMKVMCNNFSAFKGKCVSCPQIQSMSRACLLGDHGFEKALFYWR